MPTVSLPGGVIVQAKDGRTLTLGYGEEVPVEEIADHVNIASFSDDDGRVSAADQRQQALARAAQEEAGQPGSSSSPVPGNYGELDEETVARVVASLDGYPGQQAAILIHERAQGSNRQKIFDAASPEARALFEAQVGGEAEETAESSDEGSGSEDSTESAPKAPRGGKKTPPPAGSGSDE